MDSYGAIAVVAALIMGCATLQVAGDDAGVGEVDANIPAHVDVTGGSHNPTDDAEAQTIDVDDDEEDAQPFPLP